MELPSTNSMSEEKNGELHEDTLLTEIKSPKNINDSQNDRLGLKIFRTAAVEPVKSNASGYDEHFLNICSTINESSVGNPKLSVVANEDESSETFALANKKTYHDPNQNAKYWEGCSTDVNVITEASLVEAASVSSSDIQPIDGFKSKNILDFDGLNLPVEISSTMNLQNGNFFKGSKWSPDGLCFLTSSNDSRIRLYNTPETYLNENCNWLSSTSDLKPCFSVQESGSILDFTWYPLMNSNNPATCCFASTTKDQPIHLWDAFNGSLRASYIHLNSVQEVQAAQSLSFSPSGRQLLCGLKK